MLKILTAPHKVLNTPSKSVKTIDAKIKKLIRQMEMTLTAQKDPPGVGLAAPQVGVGLSLFIIKQSPKTKTQVFINPRVIRHHILNIKQGPKKPSPGSKDDSRLEGCLSIPRIWAPLKRAAEIEIDYQDQGGNKKQKKFTGFSADIVQHEMDHLGGILFTQRALTQKIQLYEEDATKLKKINY